MDRLELIAAIRRAREAAGLSQAAAAEAAGIAQPTWCQVEASQRPVTAETLVRMAEAVGLAVEYIPERFQPKKYLRRKSAN